MKVKLINVADYEIKDGKVTEIPFESFCHLCGEVGQSNDENLPKVRLFKSIDDFKLLSKDEMLEIDNDQPIRLLSNGQFLVFLKDKEKTTDSNATTDTKKN